MFDLFKDNKPGEVHARGSGRQLGDYICQEGHTENFLMSGLSYEDYRYRRIYEVISRTAGCAPVIYIHSGKSMAEYMSYAVSEKSKGAFPVWTINGKSPLFEPFYGMDSNLINLIFRQICAKMGYNATPRLNRVIGAHIEILRLLKVPVSLSGFSYLCKFSNMRQFHENVMSLDCDAQKAGQIWNDLGADETSDGRFELFRALVSELSYEASLAGWQENSVGKVNCLKASDDNAFLCLELADSRLSIIKTYIAEELRRIRRPCTVIFDEVRMENGDDPFMKFLLGHGANFSTGVVTENVTDVSSGDEKAFFSFAEKVNVFVIFKHSTGAAAENISKIIGKSDAVSYGYSKGASKSPFSIFNSGLSNQVSYTLENKYRIMPEEITSLRADQAIVFDALSDTVVRYDIRRERM